MLLLLLLLLWPCWCWMIRYPRVVCSAVFHVVKGIYERLEAVKRYGEVQHQEYVASHLTYLAQPA
jgi:hypothetical protein